MSNYRRYFNQLNNPVFITVNTKNKKNILTDNIDLLRESFKISINKFHYKFIAGVVLQNHFHILIYSENPDNIPNIVHDIKYNFTKLFFPPKINNIKLSDSEIKRGDKGIWQRRYYDHIIRDENDLYRHIDYIHYNPAKHYNIAPKDWEYSSFNKFMQKGFYELNWCNFDDKNNINSMNLE